MEEGVDKHDEHWQLGLGSVLHREDVHIGARSVDLLRFRSDGLRRCVLLSRGLTSIHLLNLLRAVDSLSQVLNLITVRLLDVVRNVSCVHLLNIPLNPFFFVLVDLLHGSLEQACREP